MRHPVAHHRALPSSLLTVARAGASTAGRRCAGARPTDEMWVAARIGVGKSSRRVTGVSRVPLTQAR